jgi:hypothetical protein
LNGETCSTDITCAGADDECSDFGTDGKKCAAKVGKKCVDSYNSDAVICGPTAYCNPATTAGADDICTERIAKGNDCVYKGIDSCQTGLVCAYDRVEDTKIIGKCSDCDYMNSEHRDSACGSVKICKNDNTCINPVTSDACQGRCEGKCEQGICTDDPLYDVASGSSWSTALTTAAGEGYCIGKKAYYKKRDNTVGIMDCEALTYAGCVRYTDVDSIVKVDCRSLSTADALCANATTVGSVPTTDKKVCISQHDGWRVKCYKDLDNHWVAVPNYTYESTAIECTGSQVCKDGTGVTDATCDNPTT